MLVAVGLFWVLVELFIGVLWFGVVCGLILV